MANYGDKNSSQRGKWWDEIIRPICSMAKTRDVGTYFTSRKNWMKEKRAGFHGSRLKSGKWPKDLRNVAKALASDLGVSWNNGKLATLSKGRSFTDALREARTAAPAPPAVEPPPPVDTFADVPPAEDLTAYDFGAPTPGVDVGSALVDVGTASTGYPAQGSQDALLTGVPMDGGAVVGAEGAVVGDEGMPTWLMVLLGLTGVGVLGGGMLLVISALKKPSGATNWDV